MCGSCADLACDRVSRARSTTNFANDLFDVNRTKSVFVNLDENPIPRTPREIGDVLICFRTLPGDNPISGVTMIVRCGSKRGALNCLDKIRIAPEKKSRCCLLGMSQ